MKILTPEAEVWGECPTYLKDAFLRIERAGRVCYRSEDKIIEGSGRKFVDGITKRKHFSVLEHSNLVLRSTEKFKFPKNKVKETKKHIESKFISFTIQNDMVYIGGNFRAWMEEFNIPTIDELFTTELCHGFEIVTNKEEIPIELKMITCFFLTDRAVTHELVRHRPCAFSQESQRYCAYRKHLEVILPAHYANIPQTKNNEQMGRYQLWVDNIEYSERTYKKLIETGERAEEARSVLPNSTATRIVVTANVPEWEHIFSLRCSKAAYPAIRNLMEPIQQVFADTYSV